jgi:hypothetical protein
VEGTRIATESGDISLAAAGDITLTLVTSQSGEIRMEAGGAIHDGSLDEDVNIETANSLSMKATRGIGSFDHLDINTRIDALNAENSESGQIIVANEDDLHIGHQGVLQMAPDGWVVLYAKTGEIERSPISNLDEQPILLLKRMSGLSESMLRAIMAATQGEADEEDVLAAASEEDLNSLRALAQEEMVGDYTVTSAIGNLLQSTSVPVGEQLGGVLGALLATGPVSQLTPSPQFVPPVIYTTPQVEEFVPAAEAPPTTETLPLETTDQEPLPATPEGVPEAAAEVAPEGATDVPPEAVTPPTEGTPAPAEPELAEAAP